MSLPTLTNDATAKLRSFWERPEGTTGMITLALLGVGGFFVAQAVLPTILSVLGMAIVAVGQGIVLALLCGVLAAVIWILTNKRFQTLVKYFFKSVMRKVTQIFVEIDPIGIMKNYVETLIDKKELLARRKEQLGGQIRVCKDQISKNEKDRVGALNTAKVARDQKRANLFQLNARIAGRLEKSNVTLQQLLSRMELLYRMLTKYYDACDTVILDLKSEVSVREQERKMILTASSAMKAAAAILRGEGDERELFDQAMEFVVEDYSKKLGEIEDFMDASKTFVDGLDLQNGVYEAEALKQLEAWESKADSILLGDEKRLMLEDHTTRDLNRITIGGAELVPAPLVESDYSKFFGSSKS